MGGNAFTSFPSAVGPVGGWVELARTTLGSASSTITVSSLADKRYYMILDSRLGITSASNPHFRMGSGTVDTGSNYAYRNSKDGGADAIGTAQIDIQIYAPTVNTVPQFGVDYIANLSAKEKLFQGHYVGQGTLGAGNAPERSESVGKWVNTSNPLDILQSKTNVGGGNYAIGSELVVLGWDPADVHTNNFWEELFFEQLVSDNQNFSTGAIPARKYLWLQFYQVGMTGNAAWIFNGDTTTSYARRHQINGNADATVTSQVNLLNVLTGGTGDAQTFTNAFIVNNSANEKLIIYTTIFGGTGAGTAPSKIIGVCKWDEVAAQITSMQIDDSGDGFDTDSFLKIWGAN